MTLSILRRTTAASTALLVAFALAGCGSDDSESTDDDAPDDTSTSAASEAPSNSESESDTTVEPASGVPSDDELESALLTTADLPEGFVEEPDDDDEDDTFDDTCLGSVGDLDENLGLEADSEAEAQFTLETNTSQAFVGSKAGAYADPETLATAFTTFSGQVQECTSVEATDDDGVTFDLDIAYDDAVVVPEADQQLGIAMTGTVAADADTFDVAYNFVIVVDGGVISLVATSEVGGSGGTGTGDAADAFAALQSQRLTDLVG